MFGIVRKINLGCLFICVLLIAFSGYLQFYQGIAPCPLCVIQRVVILTLTLVFFIGSIYIHTKTLSLKIQGAVTTFLAGLGSLAALRQIWLQHLPPDALPASCGPDLSYIVSNFPLFQALKLVLAGTGECAKVTWRFLELSIPEWTFIFFLLFLGVGIFQLMRKSI